MALGMRQRRTRFRSPNNLPYFHSKGGAQGGRLQWNQFPSNFPAQAAKTMRAWEPSPPTNLLTSPERLLQTEKGEERREKAQQLTTQQLLRRVWWGQSKWGCGSRLPCVTAAVQRGYGGRASLPLPSPSRPPIRTFYWAVQPARVRQWPLP